MLGFLGFKEKFILGVIAITVMITAIGLYGNARFNAGVTETTNRFIKADQKGADDVRTTAEKILKDSIGMSHDDVLDVLRTNGGLRADAE